MNNKLQTKNERLATVARYSQYNPICDSVAFSLHIFDRYRIGVTLSRVVTQPAGVHAKFTTVAENSN